MATATDTAFDVWLVQRNLVYQRVPYTVVGDWVVEGRLLPTDCVRPGGQAAAAWQRVGEHPLLNAFVSKPDPRHAEDPAEAMEPVELEMKNAVPEAEDDDVDMIPLIDISMVLLVFFMMTAQNLMTAKGLTKPPEAAHAVAIDSTGMLTILMEKRETREGEYQYRMYDDKGKELTAVYRDRGGVREPPQTIKGLLEAINELPPEAYPGGVRAIIKAEKDTPYEQVQQLTLQLESLGKGKIVSMQATVRQVNKGAGE